MNKMSYADVVRKAQYNENMKKTEEDRKRELSEKRTKIADAQRALREYQLNAGTSQVPWLFADEDQTNERPQLSSFYEDFHKFYRYYDESGNLPEQAFNAYFVFYEMGHEEFDERCNNYYREQDMRADFDNWFDGEYTCHTDGGARIHHRYRFRRYSSKQDKTNTDIYLEDPVPMKPAGSGRLSGDWSRCYCSFCDKVLPYYGSQKLKNTQWYRRNCAAPVYDDYDSYSYTNGRGFDDGVGKDSFDTSSDSDSDFYDSGRQGGRKNESKEAREEVTNATFYKMYDCPEGDEPCAHKKVDGVCVVPTYKELISECLENEFKDAKKFICGFQRGQLTHLTNGSDSVTETKFYKAMTDRIKHLKCGICRGATREDCLQHLPQMADFMSSLKSLGEYIRAINEKDAVFFFDIHETQQDFCQVRDDMFYTMVKLDNELESLESEMRGLIVMVNFHNGDIHSRYIRKGKSDEIPEEFRARYVKMCSLKLSIAVGYQQRYGHTKRQLIRLRELAFTFEMYHSRFRDLVQTGHQLSIKNATNRNRDRRFRHQVRNFLNMAAICA